VRLIGNALDFSRLEQGEKTYHQQELDLVAELDRLLTTQPPRLGVAGLELSRRWGGDPMIITTDADALHQVMLNLIDNACKYAGSGGTLEVELRAGEGSGAQIMVSDRGPGVPLALREKIFEKFHRVDDRLTAEQGGAGLGLGIARQLARGLGGDLICKPRDGGGASFIFKLS
jgi:two-component system phosphate regulon sensor histidine kinase PhoR